MRTRMVHRIYVRRVFIPDCRVFGCTAEEYYKNDYPDEESSAYDTEGSGTSSHTSHYFFIPLEAATLSYLQTSPLTTLTTITIGAKASSIRSSSETGIFGGRHIVGLALRASRIAFHVLSRAQSYIKADLELWVS